MEEAKENQTEKRTVEEELAGWESILAEKGHNNTKPGKKKPSPLVSTVKAEKDLAGWESILQEKIKTQELLQQKGAAEKNSLFRMRKLSFGGKKDDDVGSKKGSLPPNSPRSGNSLVASPSSSPVKLFSPRHLMPLSPGKKRNTTTSSSKNRTNKELSNSNEEFERSDSREDLAAVMNNCPTSTNINSGKEEGVGEIAEEGCKGELQQLNKEKMEGEGEESERETREEEKEKIEEEEQAKGEEVESFLDSLGLGMGDGLWYAEAIMQAGAGLDTLRLFTAEELEAAGLPPGHANLIALQLDLLPPQPQINKFSSLRRESYCTGEEGADSWSELHLWESILREKQHMMSICSLLMDEIYEEHSSEEKKCELMVALKRCALGFNSSATPS